MFEINSELAHPIDAVDVVSPKHWRFCLGYRFLEGEAGRASLLICASHDPLLSHGPTMGPNIGSHERTSRRNMRPYGTMDLLWDQI